MKKKEFEDKWDIEAAENFFNNVKMPEGEIKFNDWYTIKDAKVFVKGYLDIIKHNNGNPTFLPYLERLRGFKKYLMK